MKIFTLQIISAVLLTLSCRNERPVTTEQPPVSVKVVHIRTVPLVVHLHSNGILSSSEEMKLSFKTGGIVADIPVSEGSRVKKGTILASLDLSEINAAVDQARLGYNKALRDYERASNLHRDSVATLEQKQNAATALDLAKSKLNIARFNLEHSRITAPDNGIILKKIVKENELVASGYPVILFGLSGKFWKVKAGFADKDIVRINMGDSAVITFDAHPGVIFYGFVDQIGEMANPMTGTYEVELSLQQTDYRLASGFVAGVDLYSNSADSLRVVPVESVVEADGNQGYVFVLNNNDIAEKVKVELMNVIGPDIAVRGIPDEHKDVVSGGAAYLHDGEKVKIVR